MAGFVFAGLAGASENSGSDPDNGGSKFRSYRCHKVSTSVYREGREILST